MAKEHLDLGQTVNFHGRRNEMNHIENFEYLSYNSYSFIIIRGIRGRLKKLLFSLIPDLRLFFYSSLPFLRLNLSAVQYKELTY